MKILIVVRHRFQLWLPPAWFAERLRREFPGVEVQQFADYAAAERHFCDADVMLTWSLRAEQFAQARKLRWIHSTAAAVHALMIPEIVKSPVVVTKASPVNGPVVGEHAFALLLALARGLPAAMRLQQQRLWSQEDLWDQPPRPREVAGATLALVGTGAIGSKVAQLALAFGMNLLAVREHPERGADLLPGFSAGLPATDGAVAAVNTAAPRVRVFGVDRLDEMLAESDFAVLAAPVTPRTKTLFNRERLARMKPGAVLINVSRGALIEEAALIDALREGRLGGAALDVFEREPLPSDSPLWTLPNVVITQHSASFSETIWQRHYELFAENLRRFQAGEPLLAVVDKTKGY